MKLSRTILLILVSFFIITAGHSQIDMQPDSSNFQGKVTIDSTFENNGMIFPSSDGESGQMLSTDGNGILYWKNSEADALLNGYSPYACSDSVGLLIGSTSATFDTCGNLFDTGGPTGQYGNNEHFQLRIQPSAHILTRIILHSLDVELNRDTLWIGNAPYTGTINVGDTLIFAANRVVTIRFKSDNINVGDGFHLTWDRINYFDSIVNVPFAGFYFDPIKSAIGGGVEVESAWSLTGEKSVFFGYGAKALGVNSVAIGASAFVAQDYGVALGLNSFVGNIGGTALGVANYSTGSASSAIGNSNFSYANESTAIGILNSVNGQYGTSVGYNNSSNGEFGSSLGNGNIASGEKSSSTGYYNFATNFATSALGYQNSAGGISGTAIGHQNNAPADYSTAMGFLNNATGHSSIVIGHENVASSYSTSAIGFKTNANIYGMTTIGRHNALIGGSTTSWISSDPAFVIGIGENGSNLRNGMVIRKDGNLGIGVNSPGFQLQVQTNSAAKPTSNVWTVASDARLKQNVEPFSEGLNSILAIDPVRFTYNGKAGMPSDRGVGVIAQELIEVAPYMVSNWTYNNPKTGKEEDYLAVDNGAMTYMLINAVKEQQAIINEQISITNQQAIEILSLYQEIENLKNKIEEISNKGN